MKIIIPAREGSKGLPHKNRILLEYTIKKIPQKYINDVIIATDDEHIIDMLKDDYTVFKRSKELSEDTTSIRDVLENVIEKCSINKGEEIVMLYLTYPERTWYNIEKAIDFYHEQGAKSLLCRQELKIHPYLCLIEESGYRGKQLVDHDLYRRQDYPKCFKISLFVACYKSHIITEHMHDLLVEPDTIFYKLDQNKIDVDSQIDYNNIRI